MANTTTETAHVQSRRTAGEDDGSKESEVDVDEKRGGNSKKEEGLCNVRQ